MSKAADRAAARANQAAAAVSAAVANLDGVVTVTAEAVEGTNELRVRVVVDGLGALDDEVYVAVREGLEVDPVTYTVHLTVEHPLTPGRRVRVACTLYPVEIYPA